MSQVTLPVRISLPRLFLLAYARGFPHGIARDVLRDLARFTFQVPLEQCTDRMLEQLAESVEMMTYDPKRDKGSGKCGTGILPVSSSRSTSAQRDRVRTLASQLGWSVSTMQRFLQHDLGVESVSDLTHDQAVKAIGLLEATCRDRSRRLAAGNR